MRKRKIFFITVLVLAAFALLAVYWCNRAIEGAAEGKLYTDAAAIPYNKTGLLLGTTKYLAGGAVNPYYAWRIEAAVRLVRAGKVKYIIASGDNSRKAYNEPAEMRADLMAAGVDSAAIYLDFAGFRTFDSMVRLREVFGQDSVTVISQQFHNERALYIAGREGIAAVGFNARDVDRRAGLRVKVRERLARVKVFVDYLTGKDPKFLGPQIHLP